MSRRKARDDDDEDDYGDDDVEVDPVNNSSTFRQLIVLGTENVRRTGFHADARRPFIHSGETTPKLGEYATISDGTPHGALHSMAKMCKQILIDNRETKIDYDSLIGSLSRLTRKEMDTNKRIISDFCSLVNRTLQSLKTYLKKKGNKLRYEEEIIKLWSCILCKGISDISQYGAALRMLPLNDTYREKLPSSQLKKLTYHKFISKNKMGFIKRVCRLLEIGTIVGVSSDKIAASLMTNISSLYGDTSLSVLCTRKRESASAYIILQNYKVALLAQLIGDCQPQTAGSKKCLFEGMDTVKANFCEYTDRSSVFAARQVPFTEDRIQELFDNFFKCKEKMAFFSGGRSFFDTFEDMIKIEKTYYTRHTDSDRLRELLEIDRFSHNTVKMIEFIGNIYFMVQRNFDAFNEYAERIWLCEERPCPGYRKGNHTSYRYAYTLANIVYKLLFPFDPSIDKSEEIAQQELLSATTDAINGHDFKKVECVKTLGDLFLGIIKGDKAGIDDNEDESIVRTLRKNKMASICQNGENKFEYSFDCNNNFLISKKFKFPKPNMDWYLFECPFSFAPIFAVIDFTVGQQPFSSYKVELLNLLLDETYDLSDIKEHELFRVTYPSKIIEYISSLIERKLNTYFEVFSPPSYYDGAAPYKIRPLSLGNEYTSMVTLTTSHTLVMRTVHTKSEGPLLQNYVERNVDRGKFAVMTPLTNVISELSIEQKQVLKTSNPSIDRFDRIWKRPIMVVDEFKGDMFKTLLYGLNRKHNMLMNNFCEKYTEFDSDNLLLVNGIGSLEELKDKFKKIVRKILNVIISPSVDEAKKDELLDIFEKIVMYAETSDETYLGKEQYTKKHYRVTDTNTVKQQKMKEMLLEASTHIQNASFNNRLPIAADIVRRNPLLNPGKKGNTAKKRSDIMKYSSEYDASASDSDSSNSNPRIKGKRVTARKRSGVKTLTIEERMNAIRAELIRRYGVEQGTDYMEWFIQWNNGQASTPEGLGNVFQGLQTKFLPNPPANKQSGKTKKRGRSSSESPSSAAAAKKKKIIGPEDFGV